MKIFHHGPSSSFGGCDIFNKIGERSGQRAKGELTAAGIKVGRTRAARRVIERSTRTLWADDDRPRAFAWAADNTMSEVRRGHPPKARVPWRCRVDI